MKIIDEAENVSPETFNAIAAARKKFDDLRRFEEIPSLVMRRLYQTWPERDAIIGMIIMRFYVQAGPWADMIREG